MRPVNTPRFLNGDAAILSVDRAVGELRRGRIVGLESDSGLLLVAAAETLRGAVLATLSAQGAVAVVLAPERAAALGLPAGAPLRLALDASMAAARVMDLAGAPVTPELVAAAAARSHGPAAPAEVAAVMLAKHAGLLPAVASVTATAPPASTDVLRVRVADVGRFEQPVDAEIGRAHV